MYDTFVHDFESTFKVDTKGGIKADIIEAERFLEKYRILIERTTEQFIEPLDMFKCIDFKCRIQKLYKLGRLTSQKI